MGGWRARIGIIYPENSDSDDDYWRYAPAGVSLHIARNEAPTDGDPVEKAAAQYESGSVQTAARLLAPIRPNAVAYACSSGSFVKGRQGDRRIIETLEEIVGSPATTASTACVTALNALEAQRISVVTPYPEAKNVLLRDYLESANFKIVNFKAMQLPTDIWTFSEEFGGSISALLGPEAAYRLGKEADTVEAQAILIACTSFQTADMISALEEDVRKPVVTANQAVIWHALQLSKVKAPLPGMGRLYTL